MEEFDRILELERLIAAENAAIAEHKKRLLVLEMEQEKLRIESTPLLSEVGKMQYQGFGWSIQKGRPSAELKQDIAIESLPEQFVRKSPNKVEILKVYRQNPEMVSAFADILVSPDKITFKAV